MILGFLNALNCDHFREENLIKKMVEYELQTG